MTKLRAAARHNTALFCRAWRAGILPGAHQYDMAARVDDDGILFEGDFWPRDHGKSEICCIGYPLRKICEDPNVRILIVQKTGTEAGKTLGVIKKELESNRALKNYYAPHWKRMVGQRDISNSAGALKREGRKESTWQQHRIYVKRTRVGKDPTVEAVGVGGAITGGHFDIIILDDVEDDENTRTAERLRSLSQWFSGTILQLREPTTKVMVVGTFKTMAKDIYNFILGNPVWSCVVKSAILSPALDEIEYEPVYETPTPALLWLKPDEYTGEGATPTPTLPREYTGEGVQGSGRLVGVKVKTPGVRVMWPGKWPIEALLFEMLSSVRSVWIREKMNDLRAMAGKVFKREWFRYFEALETQYDEIIQVWDTAFDEDAEADWSVCKTVGMRNGTADVLDVFRAKLEMPDLIEAMKGQFTRWRPRAVYIENKASGKSAIQVLKRETMLPILEVDPQGKSKVERARAVTPFLESGRVRFRLGAHWLEVFEDELVLFPDGENDDQVDALVYALLILFSVLVGKKDEGPTEAAAATVHQAVF